MELVSPELEPTLCQTTTKLPARSEETAAASQSMGDQARQLQQLMGFFKLDESRTRSGISQASPQLRSVAAPPVQRAVRRLSTGRTAAVGKKAFIEWSDALSVGDPHIDQQHQKLVSIINNLHDAMASQSTQAQLQSLLDQLIAYTREHFGYEERRMRTGHYPDLAAHQKLHAALLQQVGELYAEFKQGNKFIYMDLMKFLKSWLIEHIQKTDKQYSSWLLPDQG